MINTSFKSNSKYSLAKNIEGEEEQKKPSLKEIREKMNQQQRLNQQRNSYKLGGVGMAQESCLLPKINKNGPPRTLESQVNELLDAIEESRKEPYKD